MLNDNASAAADRAAKPAAKDKVSPSASGRTAQAPAKAKAGKTDASDSDAKPADGKPIASAAGDKAAEAKESGEIVKTDDADKDKKADAEKDFGAEQIVADAANAGQPPVDPTPVSPPVPVDAPKVATGVAAPPPSDPAQTVGAGDAIATASAAAAQDQAAVEQPVIAATDPAATAEQAQTAPFDLAALQGKLDKTAKADKTGAQATTGTAVQSDSDKPSAGDATGEAESQPTPDGAPAPNATGEGDKRHAANARGEAAANGHRTPAADAPAVIHLDTGAASAKAAADAAAPHMLSATTHTTSAASLTTSSAAAQTTPQATAVPLAGVAIEIASKALAGKNRFEIRLDPPELGRIDVRLDVDRNGHVTSRLIADRSDTLDLLRRDASGLERALQDAGLKTGDNGMQFSLRDQTAGQDQRQSGSDTARLLVDDETPSAEAIPQGYGRLTGRTGGLDIRV